MSIEGMEALRQRFCERALEEADQLVAALAANDGKRIEWLAHSLAGTAGLFGYSHIGATAAALDAAFVRGDVDATDGTPALIVAIRSELADYS